MISHKILHTWVLISHHMILTFYRKLPHISPPEYKPTWHVFLLFSYCSLTKNILWTTLSPWAYHFKPMGLYVAVYGMLIADSTICTTFYFRLLRKEYNIKSFVRRKYPSLKMQADLQRNLTKVAYFIGTIYRFMDCHRTKVINYIWMWREDLRLNK